MADTINALPQYRHVILVLTEIGDGTKSLLKNPVEVITLDKKPGNDLTVWIKLLKKLLLIRPDVLHSYNLPTLEYQLLAFLLGIRIRLHAEHGRDISDPDGVNKKYRMLRRILKPLISKWVPVSQDLSIWLKDYIGIAESKIKHIPNGIDTEYFSSYEPRDKEILGLSDNSKEFVVGTIGRLDPIKNQKFLITIFQTIQQLRPDIADYLTMVIVGSGPEMDALNEMVHKAQLSEKIVLAGARYDIKALLNSFDLFVLPSIAEGIPMTILEAMSMGLPIVASDVGGIPEVIEDGSGTILSPKDTLGWSQTIIGLVEDKNVRENYGIQARKRVKNKYSLQQMIVAYDDLYQS